VVVVNRGPLIAEEPSARLVAAPPTGAELLDVRPAADVAVGHVVGAIAVPVSVPGFANRAGFVLDLDREVTLIARSHEEAAQAARLLAAVGFARLSMLEPGLPEGASIETFRVTSADGLDAAGLQVLDVREPDEQEITVAGALCVPYRDLATADLSALDPAQPVAPVCNSGVRAAVAASLLARRGFRDVRPVLEGGMPAYLRAITSASAR
jgi:hydroxyacylglutathione hydrolase